ncbi:hypothetical protein BT67DRAFT_231348 [Trichocladium antarcticum]|uniref:Uncharacterized protein n=1 Tax=Trichocladium antarcticum TaxID=1450529 RepID=A0AAN6UQK8_9PEZI|nr:hypothetical protein BT67DRAFT_231348 [Trichocladium antarcticum]
MRVVWSLTYDRGSSREHTHRQCPCRGRESLGIFSWGGMSTSPSSIPPRKAGAPAETNPRDSTLCLVITSRMGCCSAWTSISRGSMAGRVRQQCQVSRRSEAAACPRRVLNKIAPPLRGESRAATESGGNLSIGAFCSIMSFMSWGANGNEKP